MAASRATSTANTTLTTSSEHKESRQSHTLQPKIEANLDALNFSLIDTKNYSLAKIIISDLCDLIDYCQKLPLDFKANDELKKSTITEIQELLKNNPAPSIIDFSALTPGNLMDIFVFFTTKKIVSLTEEFNKDDSMYLNFLRYVTRYLFKLYRYYIIDIKKTDAQISTIIAYTKEITNTFNIVQDILYRKRKWFEIININLQLIEQHNDIYINYYPTLTSRSFSESNIVDFDFYITQNLLSIHKKQFDIYSKLHDTRHSDLSEYEVLLYSETIKRMQEQNPRLKCSLIPNRERDKQKHHELEEKSIKQKVELSFQPFYDDLIYKIFSYANSIISKISQEIDDKKSKLLFARNFLKFSGDFITVQLCSDIRFFCLEHTKIYCELLMSEKEWKIAIEKAEDLHKLSQHTYSTTYQLFALQTMKSALVGTIVTYKNLPTLEIQKIREQINKINKEINPLKDLITLTEEKRPVTGLTPKFTPDNRTLLSKLRKKFNIHEEVKTDFTIDLTSLISLIAQPSVPETKNEIFLSIINLCDKFIEKQNLCREKCEANFLNHNDLFYLRKFIFGHKAIALFYLNRPDEALDIIENNPHCMYAYYIKALIEKNKKNLSLSFYYAMQGIRDELNDELNNDEFYLISHSIQDHILREIILPYFQPSVEKRIRNPISILILDAHRYHTSNAENFLKNALFEAINEKEYEKTIPEIFFDMAAFEQHIEKRIDYLDIACFMCIKFLNISVSLQEKNRLNFNVARYLWTKYIILLQVEDLSCHETLAQLKNILLANANDSITQAPSLIFIDNALTFLGVNNRKEAIHLIERFFSSLANNPYSTKDTEIIWEKIISTTALLMEIPVEQLEPKQVLGQKEKEKRKEKEKIILSLIKEFEEKTQQATDEKTKIDKIFKRKMMRNEENQYKNISTEKNKLDEKIALSKKKEIALSRLICNINNHPMVSLCSEIKNLETGLSEKKLKLQNLITELEASSLSEEFKPFYEEDTEFLTAIHNAGKEKEFCKNIYLLAKNNAEIANKESKPSKKMQKYRHKITNKKNETQIIHNTSIEESNKNLAVILTTIQEEIKNCHESQFEIDSIKKEIEPSFSLTINLASATEPALKLAIREKKALIEKIRLISNTVEKIIERKHKLKILLSNALQQTNTISQACDDYSDQITRFSNDQKEYLELLGQAKECYENYIKDLKNALNSNQNYIDAITSLTEANKKYTQLVKLAQTRQKDQAHKIALNTALGIIENLDTLAHHALLNSTRPHLPYEHKQAASPSYSIGIEKHSLINKSNELIAELEKKIATAPDALESIELAKIIALVRELKPNIVLPEKTKIKYLLNQLEIQRKENEEKPIALLTGGIVRDLLLGKIYERKKFKGIEIIDDVDIDIMTNLSEDGINRAFPESLYKVKKVKFVPGLFIVIEKHKLNSPKIQIMQSQFFYDPKFGRIDPFFLDAMHRDIPTFYADKNGKVYTPLAITPFIFATKVFQLITNETISYREDHRRFLRALIFLVIYPEFTPTDRFIQSTQTGVDYLLSKEKNGFLVEYSNALLNEKEKESLADRLNVFLSDKVFCFSGDIRHKIFARFMVEGVIEKLFPGLNTISKEDIFTALQENIKIEDIYASFFVLLNKKILIGFCISQENMSLETLSQAFIKNKIVRSLSTKQPLLKACFESYTRKIEYESKTTMQGGIYFGPKPSIETIISNKIMTLCKQELSTTSLKKNTAPVTELIIPSTLSATATPFLPADTVTEIKHAIQPEVHMISQSQTIMLTPTMTFALPTRSPTANNRHSIFSPTNAQLVHMRNTPITPPPPATPHSVITHHQRE